MVGCEDGDEIIMFKWLGAWLFGLSSNTTKTYKYLAEIAMILNSPHITYA
jgi:hypothetical protein